MNYWDLPPPTSVHVVCPSSKGTAWPTMAMKTRDDAAEGVKITLRMIGEIKQHEIVFLL